MNVEQTGMVFDSSNRPPEHSVASFVSLCPLSSGSLLCGFQLGSAKHSVDATVRLCRSDDSGQSWRELPAQFDSEYNGVPGSLSSAELVELAPRHLLLYATWFDRSESERPLFDPQTEGILHSRQLLAETHDDGISWSRWREVRIPKLSGCSSTGPILHWQDGRIALAFESYKEFDDPNDAAHGAWLMVSRDNGQSFDPPTLIARDPEQQIFYWDQRICRSLERDAAIAMFWTHDRRTEQDRTVHLRRITLNGTLQDTTILDTGIRGQIAAPLMLQDGRLLCFVVDRTGPMTMKLWVSHNGGRTWAAEDSLLVYEHDERAALTQGTREVDFAEYWEDMRRWSFGHPAIRSLDNGRVIVAFYAGVPGCLSVHWARIDTSV